MNRPGSMVRLWLGHASVLPSVVTFILWAPVSMAQPALDMVRDSIPALAEGTRIRVHHLSLGTDPVVGRLSARRGDTLTFYSETDRFHRYQVLLDRNTRVDVSLDHHNLAGRGFLVGATVGLALGAVAVGVHQARIDNAEAWASVFGGQVPHQVASKGPIFVGLVAGAGMGALIGFGMTRDTWVPVGSPATLSVRGSLALDGRPRLMVTASF